jgi:plastocyanin
MMPPLVLLLLAAKPAPPPAWLAEEMPLPLAVRTPEDLAFKALAERQYLIFNLLAGGKEAWDQGNYAAAAEKWEALLRLPNLPPEVEAAVKPFATEARHRAGGQAATPPAVALVAPEAKPEPKPEPRPERPRRAATVAVKGVVTGGGALGPGGTVVWLERADGSTPRPKATKGAQVRQSGKTFVPRVLAVPVGSEVDFRNDDPVFHDVFSLSKPNDFDLGLYEGGSFRTHAFNTPGAVQLLCNIHSTMIGWIYVVPSPWYTQADAQGLFTLRGVPPGEYELHAWNESASKPTVSRLSVGEEGASAQVAVGGDVRPTATVPDKYGKPRQTQLGY